MHKTPNRDRLNPDTCRLLALVKKPGTVNRAYQSEPEVTRAQVHAAVDGMVRAAGVDLVSRNEMGWFEDDLARALVSGRGLALAFELNGLLLRWQSLGLEANTIQLITRIVLDQVAGISLEAEDGAAAAAAPESAPGV